MSDPAPSSAQSAAGSTFATPRGRGALALIVLLALVVRLAQLDAQSLSMDEATDLQIARGGAASLLSAEDRFPPLYHLLLGAWLNAVPWDPTGRGLSVLCGVLTVLAVGRLGGWLGGTRAGLWAATLTAVAPLAVWYSLESRAYALYLLLGAVALWQFTAAMMGDSPRNWAAFAAACILGAYTHYYFGLLIALAGIALLASWPQRRAAARGLAAFAAIAVATAPSLWLLKNDLDQPWGYARTSDFSPAALAYTYFSYLSGYTLGPSLRDLHVLSEREAALQSAPWLLALGAAATVLTWQALAYAASHRRRWLLAWLVVFCMAPATIIGVTSMFAAFGYNVRHAVWGVVPLLATLSVGAAHGRPRWLATTALTVLIACFGAALSFRLTHPAHRVEDSRAVAAFITAHDAHAPTFVLSGYMKLPLLAYVDRSQTLIALPDAGSGERAADRAELLVRQHAATGERFWLAYAREFHGDPKGVQLAALIKAFDLRPVAEFAGFRVFEGTSR